MDMNLSRELVQIVMNIKFISKVKPRKLFIPFIYMKIDKVY
jgi:hypothetical protein